MTSNRAHSSGWLCGIAAVLALVPVACSAQTGDSPTASGGSSSISQGGSASASSGSGTTASGGGSDASPSGGSSNSAGSTSAAGSSSAGSGSSGGSTNTSSCGPSADDCAAAAALTTMPISDFESGKGWFLFANPDDTGASTDPPAGDNINAEEITCPVGGRCGSSFAQHVTGKGFTDYGPSLSQDFLYQDSKTMMVVGTPMDASMYTGVMFWARKGDTAGAAPTLRLIVNDVDTHELGGVCDPSAAPGSGGMDSNACWDGWMTERALPSTWTLVKVPFTVLKQGGFGKKADAIKTDQLYGLTFQFPNMAAFDFWIDDISFYKE